MHEAQPRTSQQPRQRNDYCCRTFNSRCSAGVTVRPASAKGRDPCRLRRRHRSSRTVKAQHLHFAPLNSRSLSWQRPTTRDKLYDLISYVRKLKINVACISEMKNFNPGGERVSFVFIDEQMFILAESTGIPLDPRCRIAFHSKENWRDPETTVGSRSSER